VWKSRTAPPVNTDDPWGWGRSLDWATSCLPPRHNFDKLPRVRSESPAFDLHHPEVALIELEHTNKPNRQGETGDTSEMTGSEDHLRQQMERGGGGDGV
jgi:cytochrome c oxidase subunit I